MSNHPNRGKRRGPAANPRPADIRTARERAGLTQKQAANLIYATLRGWQFWEAGHRRMNPGLWELFQSKLISSRVRKMVDNGKERQVSK